MPARHPATIHDGGEEMRRPVSTLRRGAICTLALLALGCPAGQPDSPEIAQAFAALAGNSDTIRLAEIARFPWDRVCILTPYGNSWRVRKLLGFGLPRGAHRPLEEGEMTLVFANDGALARYTRVHRFHDLARSGHTCESKETAILVKVREQKDGGTEFVFAKDST